MGFQGGFYISPKQGTTLSFLADFGFGVNTGDGAIDNIVPGNIGGLFEVSIGNFMIGTGAGVTGGYIGSFLSGLFQIFAIPAEEASDNSDSVFYSPNDAAMFPYLRFYLSLGFFEKIFWPTIYFETYFNHGYKAGLMFNFRGYW